VTRFALDQAGIEIENKALALGSLPGLPLGDVAPIGDGFIGRFEGCDIYFSTDTGAHEVHGDIRGKYNAVQGPLWLGLPISDETVTPDGVGRFNAFAIGASIYWTSHTGPMVVRGQIRDLWGSQGFERGNLGYPVADEYRLRTLNPNTDAVIVWSLFENGAILQSPHGVAVALGADLTPDKLRVLVRAQFDKEIHKSPQNVGLHPAIEATSVSDWAFGFWGAEPRTTGFRLHGFRDNGLVAPDTELTIDVGLRFSLIPSDPIPTFTEPQSKTMLAALTSGAVTADGVFHSTIADEIADGIHTAFQHPVPVAGPFDTGAVDTGAVTIDVIGMLVTKEGGLRILVNPLPANDGNLRQLFAQRTIDALGS
jgi:hypothetical protein